MIKKQIKKALSYPLIVLCIALIVIVMLLLYVIPELQNLFADFGRELPGFTLFLIKISKQLRQMGWTTPIYFFTFYIILFCLNRKTKIKIHIPLISSIVKNYLNARWTHTLAATLDAGVPLAQALDVVAKTMQNTPYQYTFQQIKNKIVYGQSMYNTLESTELFPGYIKQMIYMGEQAGTLPMMLTQLSSFYQTEANAKVDKLLTLLEPLLIIFLGIIIGSIVIAMYLPIFRLGSITGY